MNDFGKHIIKVGNVTQLTSTCHWQNGLIPNYSFNAKELDEESGMYYYEARYYNPPVFTSRDPMFEQKPWLSPYHYCSNNPVGRVDPGGMTDEYTWVKTGDGRIVFNSTVHTDADAVEIYGEGSSTLAYGEELKTKSGKTCTLGNGGIRVDGQFHKVKDEAPFFKKVGKAIRSLDEGGHSDGGNTGRITQQDVTVGLATLSIMSGIGVLCEGGLGVLGCSIVSAGMANNVDNMFTNCEGKSGLQQLAGQNGIAVSALGYGKDFVSFINLGYDFSAPQKIIQSPFYLMNTAADIFSVGNMSTTFTKKRK